MSPVKATAAIRRGSHPVPAGGQGVHADHADARVAVGKAFDLNGYVGIVYFAATALSLYIE